MKLKDKGTAIMLIDVITCRDDGVNKTTGVQEMVTDVRDMV